MKTIYAVLILIFWSGWVAASPLCFITDAIDMDIRDVKSRVKLAVRWDDGNPEDRKITVLTLNDRPVTGSGLNCNSRISNPPTCNLDHDAGEVTITRSVENNAETLALRTEIGELHVSSLKDSNEPVLMVDTELEDGRPPKGETLNARQVDLSICRGMSQRSSAARPASGALPVAAKPTAKIQAQPAAMNIFGPSAAATR